MLYVVLYMGATRTQIYLTTEQRKRLDARRRRERKTLAQLVREAIDAYLGAPSTDAQRIVDGSFGAIPDFNVPPRHGSWEKRERRLGVRG